MENASEPNATSSYTISTCIFFKIIQNCVHDFFIYYKNVEFDGGGGGGAVAVRCNKDKHDEFA